MKHLNTKAAASERPPERRRNAVATRQAILDSARVAFTRSGYDGVGVREIAQAAGVTAMLVNRYFGSKQQLFEEVVEVTLSAPGILTNKVTEHSRDASTLGREVAIALVARKAPEVTPMDGFLILLRSAANEQAARILREKFAQNLAKPLATLLPGSRTVERAAMFLGVIAGFQVMRQIVGISGLAEAEPSDLSDQLEALFEVLVAGHADNQMPKKRSIPESLLQGEPWPFSLEQDLAVFLMMLEERFRKDTSDPLPAFEALSYIASYVWLMEKPSTYTLPIPWWAIQALAIGFNSYRDAAGSTTPTTLGEAYNLEGRGQGKEPRIQRGLRQLRDIRIGIAIATARANGVKIEAAMQEQADKTSLSVAQVRRIWETNRRQASSAVRNFRTRITS